VGRHDVAAIGLHVDLSTARCDHKDVGIEA
jgi:hypothetical protein